MREERLVDALADVLGEVRRLLLACRTPDGGLSVSPHRAAQLRGTLAAGDTVLADVLQEERERARPAPREWTAEEILAREG